jgi:hypothetical protein
MNQTGTQYDSKGRLRPGTRTRQTATVPVMPQRTWFCAFGTQPRSENDTDIPTGVDDLRLVGGWEKLWRHHERYA